MNPYATVAYDASSLHSRDRTAHLLRLYELLEDLLGEADVAINLRPMVEVDVVDHQHQVAAYHLH